MNPENGCEYNVKSVEGITVGDGFGNHGLIRKSKKRMVYGIREFPVGCGPLKMHSCDDGLENPIMLPCSISSPEDLVEEAVSPLHDTNEAELHLERENSAMLMTLTSSNQASSKLSKKTDFVARVYPPRRKRLGERDFPPGCGRVPRQSGTSTTRIRANSIKESRGKVSTNERDFPPGCGRDGALTAEVPRQSGISTTCIRANSIKESQGKVSTNMASSLDHRTVVMGLMAPQNCPWTQNKRRVPRAKRARG